MDTDVLKLRKDLDLIREQSSKGFCASQMTYYAVTWAEMRVTARKLGYALSLHGSLKRDLDVVAIPWTEEAVDPWTLVKEVCETIGGFVLAPQNKNDQPCVKPHGRLVWIINFGGASVLGPDEMPTYIDFSVMPRVKKEDSLG